MPEENLDTSKDGDATASESAVLAQVVEASPALGKAWSQRWQIPLFAAALVAWAWFLVDTHRQIKADQEDPAIVGARIEAMYRGGLHERVVRDATIFQTVHPGSDERAVVEYYGGMSAFVLAQTLAEKKEEPTDD